MTFDNNRLTGKELESALLSGDLEPARHHVTGMVKASDKRGTICFTPSDCDRWVDVPVELIESAVRVGTRQCKDHQHPMFKLRLKDATDDLGRIALQMLSAMSERDSDGASASLSEFADVNDLLAGSDPHDDGMLHLTGPFDGNWVSVEPMAAASYYANGPVASPRPTDQVCIHMTTTKCIRIPTPRGARLVCVKRRVPICMDFPRW